MDMQEKGNQDPIIGDRIGVAECPTVDDETLSALALKFLNWDVDEYDAHTLRMLRDFAQCATLPSCIDKQRSDAVANIANVTIVGDADAVAAATAALEAGPLPAYPDELTPELREVLGWMCFQCISIAQAMRAAGIDVKKRAEDEQAHVLHWMVKLVLRHGADWRKAGTKDLEMWRDRARELSDKSDGAPA
ncbi:hypothetical protein [Paraburkholderia acidiphila]|uniref:Uncharacterized protein n=1 Tax=Paraburkholderia acidiphila TaxID=2571747 RepID=A0A7Z2J9T6_9BURK|nr:hypothetical protein [Paraburkholderia acidiphila]QGZ56706.1 hypothetical protein FAZ97_17220 [Paraburkholderia acidiphila]